MGLWGRITDSASSLFLLYHLCRYAGQLLNGFYLFLVIILIFYKLAEPIFSPTNQAYPSLFKLYPISCWSTDLITFEGNEEIFTFSCHLASNIFDLMEWCRKGSTFILAIIQNKLLRWTILHKCLEELTLGWCLISEVYLTILGPYL